MAPQFSKWIFVTGAPRSGTSFVGSILSWPLTVDLIYEPTDPIVGIPGINRRYRYLPPQAPADDQLARSLAGLFTYEFSYRSPPPRPDDGLFTRYRKRIVGPRGAVHLWLAKHNPFHTCAVIKDPDGCLLTEYLFTRHHVRPVLCIRHPTAFVASYLSYHFPWDLPEISEQPNLIRDYFGGDTSLFEVNPEDQLAGTAVLWLALNRVLLDQCSRHPEWILVVHEELCRSPVSTFRQMFERLDLDWSKRVERAIVQRTGPHNKTGPAPGKEHDHHRNSAQLFDARRAMLSLKERERIFDITRDVALQVYSRESFGLS